MEFGSAAYEHGVYAVDLARTALEAVIDTAKAKRRGHVGAQSIADRQVFEASPEKAELRIKAARPLIVNASQQLFASAADQAAPAAYCNTEALEVTTDLIRYAGRRALMSGHPLEKVLRDIYAAQSHLFVSESACFKARAGPRALLLILSDPGKVRTPRRSGGLSRALAPGERVWPVMNAATDNQSLMGVSVTSLAQLPRPSSAQRLADFTYAPGNQPSIHKPVRRGRPGLGRPRADLRLTGHATRFRIQVRSRLSCRTGFGELRASYQPVTKRRYASSGCLYQLSYA